MLYLYFLLIIFGISFSPVVRVRTCTLQYLTLGK